MAREPNLFISTNGAQDKPAVDALNRLFYEAGVALYRDIQIRFKGSRVTIQKVLDRVETLYEIDDEEMARTMEDRLRSKAKISATARDIDGDGRSVLRYTKAAGYEHEFTLELRVNVVPTAGGGSTFVIRIQNGQDSIRALDDIPMSRAVRRQINKILRLKQGVVVVCGPTGSGKTTLLMSILKALAEAGKNIKTAEHPVEITLPNVDHCETNREFTTARAIRAFMRQRPHVIVVGEARDPETAAAAAMAGNTGHLVILTNHADDASTAIARLRELGLDRATLAQSVKYIIAQRLLDTVRPDRRSGPRNHPSEVDKYWLKSAGVYYPTDTFLSADEDELDNTVRVPLMEVIQVTTRVKRAILDPDAGIGDIVTAASVQPSYESLADNAVRMARGGIVTLDTVQTAIDEVVTPYHSERVDKMLIASGVITPEQAFDAIEAQAELHQRGQDDPLWRVLIDRGLTTLEQVIDALGRTSDAEQRMAYFVDGEKIDRDVAEAVKKRWLADGRTTSLYQLLLAGSGLSHEEIYETTLLHYRRVGLAPLE